MPDPPLYLKGAEVHVFHDWKRTGGWFPTATHADGRHPPRKGFTHGWVRATVAEDWHEGRFNALDKSTWVALEPRAPLWYNRDGALWGGPQPPCARAHPRDVRSREPSLRMSVFVVRWGGPAPAFDPDSWGPTGSVVSDLFVDSMLDDVAGPAVYPEAEVYTAFVTCSEDLRRLDPPVLRGRHRCAMYFLYPCEFRDSVCAPAYVNKVLPLVASRGGGMRLMPRRCHSAAMATSAPPEHPRGLMPNPPGAPGQRHGAMARLRDGRPPE